MPHPANSLLIAGAGIGGLAAATACARAGWQVQVFEQAPAFSPVGAGIQLGPNATRVLHGWGLAPALAAVACEPAAVRVRDAHGGQLLGCLPLGAAMRERYGAPYCTVHRADLHGLLLQAAQGSGAQVQLQCAIKNIANNSINVLASTQNGSKFEAAALLGADGLWSTVRQQLGLGGMPQATGHVAWRALLAAQALPSGVSAHEVSVWLGPRLHLLCYPVRSGACMNLVFIAAGPSPASLRDWGGPGDAPALPSLAHGLYGLHGLSVALMQAASGWQAWALCESKPLAAAQGMACGRVALLGDAAHAMLPYLAQGGAMALEDAAQLAVSLRQAGDAPGEVASALQHYAQARWQRNARVQRRARRNGLVFHAHGPLRWARNLAMRAGGARLLDSPWLYRA